MNASPETQPAYEFVLFDWDGCLAHTLEAWMASFLCTNRAFQLEPSRDEIVLQFGNPNGPKSFGLPEDQLEAYWTHLFEDVHARLAEVPLFDGAVELVRKLRSAGCKTAVITSSPGDTLARSFDRLHINDAFDTVIVAEDVTHHKPNPEALELAIHRLGASKERTLMVGDSDKDLGAGRNAGVDTMLMYPPENALFHNLEFLMTFEPTYVCHSFRDAEKPLLPA